MIKRIISFFLSLVILISGIPLVYASSELAKSTTVLYQFHSYFYEKPVYKNFLIVGDDVMLDAGTLADLTGYECVKKDDIFIEFSRGIRKISVNKSGKVLYNTGEVREFSNVHTENGMIYLPFSAALRMLGACPVPNPNSNTMMIECNVNSFWDDTFVYKVKNIDFNGMFDVSRDWSVDVNGVLIGIAIATFYDRTFQLIADSFISGTNDYKNSMLYFINNKNEAYSESVFRNQSEIDFMSSTFEVFGSDIVGNSMEYLLNDDLMQISSFAEDYSYIIPSFKMMGVASNFLKVAKVTSEYAEMLENLSNKDNSRLNISSTVLYDANGKSKSDISPGIRSGVEQAISMAHGEFVSHLNHIVDEGKQEYLKMLADLNPVFLGFSFSNAVMHMADVTGTFDKMDDTVLALGLIDMQKAVRRELATSWYRIKSGTATENDYIYVWRALQFVYNSNIEICELLKSTYRGNSDKNIQTMLSYWEQRVETSKTFLIDLSVYSEQSIRRDSCQASLIVSNGALTISDILLNFNKDSNQLNSNNIVANDDDFHKLKELLDEYYELILSKYNYSTDKAEDIISGLICNGISIPGLNYYFGYSETDEIQNDGNGEKDPLDKFSKTTGMFYKMPADKVDWIIENIFNAKPDHSINTDLLYYFEGFYYHEAGDGGYIGHWAEIRNFTLLEDGKYEIVCDYYSLDYDDNNLTDPWVKGNELYGTTHIIADLKEINIKKYWTFYSIEHYRKDDKETHHSDSNSMVLDAQHGIDGTVKIVIAGSGGDKFKTAILILDSSNKILLDNGLALENVSEIQLKQFANEISLDDLDGKRIKVTGFIEEGMNYYDIRDAVMYECKITYIQ